MTATTMLSIEDELVSARHENPNVFVNVCELDSEESPLLGPSPLKPTMNSMLPQIGKKKHGMPAQTRRNKLKKGCMNADLRSCSDFGRFRHSEKQLKQMF